MLVAYQHISLIVLEEGHSLSLMLATGHYVNLVEIEVEFERSPDLIAAGYDLLPVQSTGDGGDCV